MGDGFSSPDRQSSGGAPAHAGKSTREAPYGRTAQGAGEQEGPSSMAVRTRQGATAASVTALRGAETTDTGRECHRRTLNLGILIIGASYEQQ